MSRAAQLLTTLLVLLCLILTPILLDSAVTRAQEAASSDEEFVAGEVLVKWNEGASDSRRQSALVQIGHYVLAEVPRLRVSRLAVAPGQELALARRLVDHPLLAYAEPNYIAHAHSNVTAYPDDPDWIKLWNIRRVKVDQAWELSTGNTGLAVAVLDSGIDISHSDINANLLPGYDFVNDDADPTDDYGHGTHVSGTLAARVNNGKGVAGVAPDVSIMPIKVLDENGSGTYLQIAEGILYAIDHGAVILNLSLGGGSSSTTMANAVDAAEAAGVLVVASAGNQGSTAVNYPARYDSVLAIAATDHYDLWPAYSNRGAEVDLAAPGGISADQVWSTWPGGGYDWEYGTSMSAAHVSGAAALVWDVNPSLTHIEVANILKQTTDQVGQFDFYGGRNDYLGSGRLNVHAALREAMPPELDVTPDPLIFLGDSTQAPAAGHITLSNESLQQLQWSAAITNGDDWLNLPPPTSGSISFGAPDQLTILPSTGSLGYGLHEGSLLLTSTTPTALGLPRTVPLVVSLVPSLKRVFLPYQDNGHTRFQWIDATGGQPLHLDDDSTARLDLPWAASFYEHTYDELWVGANGTLSFEELASGGSAVYNNTCLPTADQPNAAIYPFWDDLNPSNGGQVYAMEWGDDALVVEWHEVPHFDGTRPETFEVILHQDGLIVFQYLDLSDDSSVTVGVENYDGTMAWQWLCNGQGTGLRSGTAMSYHPPDFQ